MDIFSYVAAIASCVTAIATAVTVIVAIRQFNKTLKHAEEEHELLLKENAALLDARIVVSKDSNSQQHHILIENNTNAAVYDVEIETIWLENTIKGECVEKSCSYKTIPKGAWIISRNFDGSQSYFWKFPQSITDIDLNAKYEPRFLNDRFHIVKNISFSDSFGSRWKKDLDTRCISKVDKPKNSNSSDY